MEIHVVGLGPHCNRAGWGQANGAPVFFSHFFFLLGLPWPFEMPSGRPPEGKEKAWHSQSGAILQAAVPICVAMEWGLVEAEFGRSLLVPPERKRGNGRDKGVITDGQGSPQHGSSSGT